MATSTPNFNFTLPAVADVIDQDLWGTELNSNFTSIDSLLLALNPVGTYIFGAWSTAPAGYLLTYGQAVSRTTYAALFALISTTYGVGDGTTTFNLPDRRGRQSTCLDNLGGSAASRVVLAVTLGVTGGLETTTASGSISGLSGTTGDTTLSSSQVPVPSGNSMPGDAANNTGTNAVTRATTPGGAGTTLSNLISLGYGGGSHNHSLSGITGTFTASPVESMNPYMADSWAIKY